MLYVSSDFLLYGFRVVINRDPPPYSLTGTDGSDRWRSTRQYPYIVTLLVFSFRLFFMSQESRLRGTQKEVVMTRRRSWSSESRGIHILIGNDVTAKVIVYDDLKRLRIIKKCQPHNSNSNHCVAFQFSGGNKESTFKRGHGSIENFSLNGT